jgi:predicted GNAT family acetyltransferase
VTGHVLDRPVWSALASRQATFSRGGDRARRFDPDVAPFAAACDDAPESVTALGELFEPGETAMLLQADALRLPPGLAILSSAAGVQMVADRIARAGDDPTVARSMAPLTEADIPAMVALATSTRPGPFSSRTAHLGAFLGVKEEGVLIAMAGERMKQPGFTEVSGVCTAPRARGRGLARALSAAVAARILERGETPYLHAYATNTPAIRLYESLGFRLRREMFVATIGRAG